jgi:hypothetical protein
MLPTGLPDDLYDAMQALRLLWPPTEDTLCMAFLKRTLALPPTQGGEMSDAETDLMRAADTVARYLRAFARRFVRKWGYLEATFHSDGYAITATVGKGSYRRHRVSAGKRHRQYGWEIKHRHGWTHSPRVFANEWEAMGDLFGQLWAVYLADPRPGVGVNRTATATKKGVTTNA